MMQTHEQAPSHAGPPTVPDNTGGDGAMRV